jgi:hypothetical protein
MFWRLITAMVVLFWAVMTGLVIRDTYFPDYSRFAVVPVHFVFDLFLSEAAAFNNTLHLYQGREKIGHTTFALRRLDEKAEQEPIYAIAANGSVAVPGTAEKTEFGFRLNGELMGAERWQRFEIQIHAPQNETEAVIAWKEGDKLPQMEVKKGGKVIMNTAMAQTMMDSPAASGLITQLLPAGALPQAAAMRLQAREGRLELAAKQRRCYVITATLMQGYEAQLYFTEIGELARVDLPGGYRLLEPMLHGLEKGLTTEL